MENIILSIDDLRAIARARAWRQHSKKFWVIVGAIACLSALLGLFGTLPVAIAWIIAIGGLILINRKNTKAYNNQLAIIIEEINRNDCPILYVSQNYRDAIEIKARKNG